MHPGRKPWLYQRVLVLGGLFLGVMVGMPTPFASGGTEDAVATSIQVPGSPLAISLWTEVSESGETRSLYVVAFDGLHFSAPQEASYYLLLGYEMFDPAVREPAVPEHLAADLDTNAYLVQYVTQPFPEFRRQIEALGGSFGRYVPSFADVVIMAPDVRDSVAALPYVRSVRPYHPAYRLEPGIRTQLEQAARAGEVARYSLEVQERGPAQQQAVAARITALGGVVHFITPEGFRMEATMSPAVLLDVVRADEINYIDQWGGPGEVDMNIARGTAGSNADFIQTTLGYTGQGVRGEVFDTGVRATHQAFQSPGILLHTTNGGDTSHGTSTYGIVFGTGAGNANGRGMLPGREQGIFAYSGQVTQFGGSKTRHQHTAELVDPNGPYRAVFQSSSVGSTRTTAYTSISAEVDDYLFLYDLLSLQSQSNAGTQNSRPQAWAKNIVSIGGLYHYDNTSRADDRWDSGASVGPAADGRIKPDLTHFYDATLCPTDTSDTAYTTGFGGTSAATPIVAGACGLLLQMWHNGIWPGHGGAPTVFLSRPHMATAKALLINTAYQYALAGEVGYTDLTRYRQGWGMPDLQDLYTQRTQTYIVDETDVLLPLQTRTYWVQMPAGEPSFKVTMVYTDPAGNPAVPNQHRVNDLTLKVTAPGGTYYYGNNGLTTARWSPAGGSADTKNTVENVFLQTPAAGLWNVEVIGSQIVADSHPETPGVVDADYALVICGGTVLHLGDADCSGVVNFADINAFVLALNGEASYNAQYPNCNWHNADCNADGDVSFADINPFVALLSGSD